MESYKSPELPYVQQPCMSRLIIPNLTFLVAITNDSKVGNSCTP